MLRQTTTARMVGKARAQTGSGANPWSTPFVPQFGFMFTVMAMLYGTSFYTMHWRRANKYKENEYVPPDPAAYNDESYRTGNSILSHSRPK
ncbi:hypothetical protein DIPPA_10140 [Diplonema papillatum]|nr:hypothetical protein DIPPA_10140 [Diplonema papillatum]